MKSPQTSTKERQFEAVTKWFSIHDTMNKTQFEMLKDIVTDILWRPKKK